MASTASLLNPEIVITPDPARAADLGVSTVDIAAAARIATSGDFRRNLAKLNLAERQIPIRVQIADTSLSDAALLSLLRVPSRNGTVPLSAVATITDGSGPAQIERFNRERNIKISAELNGQPLGNVTADLRKTDGRGTTCRRACASCPAATPRPSPRCSWASASPCSRASAASTWCCCCSSAAPSSRW